MGATGETAFQKQRRGRTHPLWAEMAPERRSMVWPLDFTGRFGTLEGSAGGLHMGLFEEGMGVRTLTLLVSHRDSNSQLEP